MKGLGIAYRSVANRTNQCSQKGGASLNTGSS